MAAKERVVHSVVKLFIWFCEFVHSVFRSFIFTGLTGERSVDHLIVNSVIRLSVCSSGCSLACSSPDPFVCFLFPVLLAIHGRKRVVNN